MLIFADHCYCAWDYSLTCYGSVHSLVVSRSGFRCRSSSDLRCMGLLALVVDSAILLGFQTRTCLCVYELLSVLISSWESLPSNATLLLLTSILVSSKASGGIADHCYCAWGYGLTLLDTATLRCIASWFRVWVWALCNFM